MSDLVRVRLNGVEKNAGAAFARIHGLEVLDQPTHNGDGSPRRETRAGGRSILPRVSVAEAAEKKRRRRRRDRPFVASEPVPPVSFEAFNPPITAAVSESADDSEE